VKMRLVGGPSIVWPLTATFGRSRRPPVPAAQCIFAQPRAQKPRRNEAGLSRELPKGACRLTSEPSTSPEESTATGSGIGGKPASAVMCVGGAIFVRHRIFSRIP
jgi:hypothetical protein